MSGDTISPIWHPFAQHALHSAFPQVVRAEGAYLTLQDGQRILDAISSCALETLCRRGDAAAFLVEALRFPFRRQGREHARPQIAGDRIYP